MGEGAPSARVLALGARAERERGQSARGLGYYVRDIGNAVFCLPRRSEIAGRGILPCESAGAAGVAEVRSGKKLTPLPGTGDSRKEGNLGDAT